MSEDRDIKLKAKIVDYLLQQGVPTILLFSILGLGVYALNIAVPQHLRSIQDGYLAIEKSSNERAARWQAAVKELAEDFRDIRTQDRALVDKILIQLERNRAIGVNP